MTVPWPHRDPFFPDGETEAAHRQDDVLEKRRAAHGVDHSVVWEEPMARFGTWQKRDVKNSTFVYNIIPTKIKINHKIQNTGNDDRLNYPYNANLQKMQSQNALWQIQCKNWVEWNVFYKYIYIYLYFKYYICICIYNIIIILYITYYITYCYYYYTAHEIGCKTCFIYQNEKL